jgi:hypothetical protein
MRIRSSMRTDARADSATVSPRYKDLFFAGQPPLPSRFSTRSGSRVPGFTKAISMGVAVAFCLYGVWQIWHIIMYPH